MVSKCQVSRIVGIANMVRPQGLAPVVEERYSKRSLYFLLLGFLFEPKSLPTFSF
jgi:hypothetical protein